MHTNPLAHASILAMCLATFAACSGDKPLENGIGQTPSALESAGTSSLGGDASAAPSPSARAALDAIRNTCAGYRQTPVDGGRPLGSPDAGPTTSPLDLSSNADVSSLADNGQGEFVPTFAADAVQRTWQKARVTIPRQLDRAVRVVGQTKSATITVAISGASRTQGEHADGYVIYQDAHGPGGHVVRRPNVDGFEDFFAFPRAPASPEVAYDVQLEAGIAGLRLVSNTLEFLDADGMPRLRVSPPQLRTASCELVEAKIAVEQCAVDSDPRVPWGRAVTAAGATSCRVRVSWDAQKVTYPALLDPWVTTNLWMARWDFDAVPITAGGVPSVLVAGGAYFSGSVVQATAQTEVLNTTTGAWTITGPLTYGRWGHRASVVGGNVVVTGGQRPFASHGGGRYPRAIESYNPASGMWTVLTNLSSSGRRAYHSATVVSSGTKILVTGGT